MRLAHLLEVNPTEAEAAAVLLERQRNYHKAEARVEGGRSRRLKKQYSK